MTPESIRERNPPVGEFGGARGAGGNHSGVAPFGAHRKPALGMPVQRSNAMNGIIYLVGLIVVIMFILSFLGLR